MPRIGMIKQLLKAEQPENSDPKFNDILIHLILHPQWVVTSSGLATDLATHSNGTEKPLKFTNLEVV